MHMQDNAVRHPPRGACLCPSNCKLLHQRGAVRTQCIHAHGERRARIIAEAERLRTFVAVGAHPTLDHPRRMPRPERKCARIPSRRQSRTLGRAQRRTENAVDERIRTPAPMQEFADSGLSLADIGDILPDHIVERFPRLCDAVDKLGQKAAVALRELRITQRLCERDIRIRALDVNFLQYLHCQLTHAVDFVLTISLHYAPFSVTCSTGSMISSS